jgi:hypothetical protein
MKTNKITDPYKTIDDVWLWRQKAYGEIESFPEAERLRRICLSGKKYTSKLHLRRVENEMVKSHISTS